MQWRYLRHLIKTAWKESQLHGSTSQIECNSKHKREGRGAANHSCQDDHISNPKIRRLPFKKDCSSCSSSEHTKNHTNGFFSLISQEWNSFWQVINLPTAKNTFNNNLIYFFAQHLQSLQNQLLYHKTIR